jgi:glycosyltransferase involved in cell wall biosynthesis
VTGPLLSFIVPVRNDAARLERCLASIHRTMAGPFEVIVVDNGSTDNSAKVAEASGARVLLRPGLAVSQMRNEAASVASGDLLGFVDADHELSTGWWPKAAAVLHDRGVSAAGAQYSPPEQSTRIQRAYDRLRHHRQGTYAAEWIPSGNLVVRADVFRQIGGFDTSLETCEDVDLCQRILATGGQIVESDGMRSIHFGDPATLKALFFGELWRGRDSIRVSLRARQSWRSAFGLMLSLVSSLAAAAVGLGMIGAYFGGLRLALTGIFVMGAVAFLRAARMYQGGSRGENSRPSYLDCMAVAYVYETARALAPFFRVPHTIRRRGHS